MAEVTVGARTGPFSAGLARMQNQWATFKKGVEKKFSFADAGKSLLAGLGIGSVAGVAAMVGDHFRFIADMAEQFAESTRNAYNNTRALLSLRFNPEQNIKFMEKDVGFQREQIASQEAWIKRMQDSVLSWTPQFEEEIARATQKLTEMKNQLGQSHVAIEQARIAARKRNEGLGETQDSLRDDRAVLERRMSPAAALEAATSRAFRRWRENMQAPDSREYMIAYEQARLAQDRAREAQRVAQVRGITGDSLARIGGGGRIFAPSGDPAASPAQALVTEAGRHTKLLTAIVTNTKPGGITARFTFRK